MAVVSKPATKACTCAIGYVCDCKGIPKTAFTNKRKLSDADSKKEVSGLMRKRLDPEVAHPDIVKKIMEKGCCQNENCLQKLFSGNDDASGSGTLDLYGWEGIPSQGFGPKFLRAVVAARTKIYQKGQYQSYENIKNMLQRDVHEKHLEDLPYKFYHEGLLGDAPSVPSGIRVSVFRKSRLPVIEIIIYYHSIKMFKMCCTI